MESNTTVVQADGSIEISEEFRARRGWGAGTELVLVVRDDRVFLVTRDEVDSGEEVHHLSGKRQSDLPHGSA